MQANDWPTLAALRMHYVRRVLNHTAGNMAHAARILGIDRTTLYRLLAEGPHTRHAETASVRPKAPS
jgi:DNA-binding NtrC family response regulator